MVNTPKIKGRMAELNYTQQNLAKALGISASTVSQKINGNRPLFLDEADVLAELLKVDNEHFREFFIAKNIA